MQWLLYLNYGYKKARLTEAKASYKKLRKTTNRAKPDEVNLRRQQAAQGTPDPKAEAWSEKNLMVWSRFSYDLHSF